MRTANHKKNGSAAPSVKTAKLADASKDATRLHQEGRLDEAEAAYRQILKAQPDHAQSLHLLGVIHSQRGNHQEAVKRINAALKINPRLADAFNNLGIALKALGHLNEALASYDKAIALKPDYHDAFNNRGIVLKEMGRIDDAVASYDSAIAVKPDSAAAFYNRGLALAAMSQLELAIESYDHAIAFKPDYVEAFSGRAHALTALKRWEEAVASFDALIKLNPHNAKAVYERANTLKQIGRADEALAGYDLVIVLEPDHAEAFNTRGVVLKDLKRFEDAVASFDEAIRLRPTYPEALNNRGIALCELKRFEDALATADKAIALRPRFAEGLNTRGMALSKLGRWEDALASYDEAVACKSEYADAFNNRAIALAELTRFDDALESYDRAVALKPSYAEAVKNRGMTKLLVGRWPEGWADYEWRWMSKTFPSKRPETKVPEWQGEDINGRRLVIYNEQGLGDTVQFARYLRLLADRGAIVTFSAPSRLCRVLAALGTDIEIVSSIQNGVFDFCCALMSLPLHLATEPTSVPNAVPYLKPEEDRVALWKSRLGEHGLKVGIAWQGKPDGQVDRGRSFPVAELIPLARLPGVRLISLQKNHGLDQLASLPADVRIETLGEDFDSGADAFIDTAAVMANLDLIITSDTSIAHLAGALGRPTWVALKRVPDWRWLLDREDSPWYPTMRLYRQPSSGDWKSVFAKMEQKLKALLSDMAVKPVPPRAPKPHKGSEPKPSATTTPNAGTSNGSDRQPTMDSGNLRIKHCRHGMMMFHTNDTYIGRSLDLYGEFSEGETEIFQQLLRPGMTVVDAGANIGAHTLYFARAVGQTGRVLAFEPQRVLYQMLCGNIALNGLRNVRAENAALGAEAGTLLVPQLDYTKGGNFGGVPLGEWKHGEEIPVRTLDSYVLSSCHLIKIDVEGMERVVLEGAADVLKTHKPFLYVENDRREKSKALIEWLLSKGYRLYWHTPPLFNPNNHFGEKKNVFAKTVSRNMLCVPRNKALKSPLQEITSPDVNWRGPRNPNKTDQ